MSKAAEELLQQISLRITMSMACANGTSSVSTSSVASSSGVPAFVHDSARNKCIVMVSLAEQSTVAPSSIQCEDT